jgi:predicted esterase
MARDLRAPRSARGLGFVCVSIAVTVATAGVTALGGSHAEAASTDTVVPAAEVPFAERNPVYVTSADKSKPQMLVYPARLVSKGEAAGANVPTKPRPLVVMLHGMCDVAENECPAFAGTATRDRVLLCPRANLRCDGGGTLWSGKTETRTELLAGFLDRAARALPDAIDPNEKPTLVGFSLGSFVALDVAQRSPGTYKNLILLGAKVEPDAKLLRAAGIESVLFGAGDRDMMRTHMSQVAERLAKQGIRSRFVGLGDVGHWFAPDMNTWLADAFAWLELPPTPPVGG